MYTVQLAKTREEVESIHQFTASVYYQHGYIPYPEALTERPPHAVYVTKEEDIVGSLGIYFGREEHRLPTDTFFSQPDESSLCERTGYNQAEVVEISRFCISGANGDTKIAILLLGILYEVLVQEGCQAQAILACVKPSLLHHLKAHYGLPVEGIRSPLNSQVIPSAYHNYFLPPDPKEHPLAMFIRLDHQGRKAFYPYHRAYLDFMQRSPQVEIELKGV